MTAAISAVPLVSLLTLSQHSKLNVTGWENGSFHGLHSQVKLFIDGLPVSTNAVPGRQASVSSNPKDRIPDLVAEIPLNSLGSWDNDRLRTLSSLKWCISSKSVLKKKTVTSAAPGTQATTPVAIASTTEDKCELKHFSEEEAKKETSEGVIAHLLSLVAKFLETQHASNMLMLYDLQTVYENTNGTSGNLQQKIERIQKACDLPSKESKAVVKDLFLSSNNGYKSCLMAPVNVRVNLSVSNNGTQQASNTPSTDVTKDNFSKGVIKGQLSYGVFDYSDYTKLKLITLNGATAGSSNNKNTFLNLNWPLPWEIGNSKSDISSYGNDCLLKELHKKVLSRELKMEIIKSQCITPNL